MIQFILIFCVQLVYILTNFKYTQECVPSVDVPPVDDTCYLQTKCWARLAHCKIVSRESTKQIRIRKKAEVVISLQSVDFEVINCSLAG